MLLVVRGFNMDTKEILTPGQLNALQKIKDAYATGEIDNDDDYLDRLTDFMNDEAPDEVRNAYNDDEESDIVKQYEHEVFADTPWAKELTSTGSTKKELGDAEDKTTISDSREKRIAKMKRSWGKTRTQKQLEGEKERDDPRAGGEVFGPGATVSDATMKNILAALTNRRF